MITEYLSNAELALASYANLSPGIPNTTALHDDGKGMSAAQAADFSDRYTIVTQYNDTPAENGMGTSFSATVFRDTSGNLTLAIRGTLEGGDYMPTDADIALHGAGYDQIVAMYNWWQREATPSGQMVAQFSLTTLLDGIDPVPIGAVELFRVEGNGPVPIDRVTYLMPSEPVQATGGLANVLSTDSNGLVDVAGHSLGGHLAMGFGALFSAASDQVTVFNAPGFIDNATNQSFFGALGGYVPSGVNTTNVIADEAGVSGAPWSAIAGLYSRPGVAIDIPIENQWLSDEPDKPGARNHSQQTLTDALAVYATLNKLDPALTSESFRGILSGAVAGSAGSLEGIVDVLEGLFGINTTPLPTGNSNRDDLYQALYGLRDSVLFDQVSGMVTVQSFTGKTLSDLTGLAASEIAYRYALVHANPFAITGDDTLYALHNSSGELDLYDPQTGQGHLTSDYLNDRAAFVLAQIDFNLNGTQTHAPEAIEYHDITSTVVITETTTNSADITRRIVFGSEGNDVLDQGGRLADHLYGGKGRDRLSGGDGDDYLEGGQGSDWMDGGIGTDTYFYKPGDGEDTLSDSDGLGVLHIGGHTIAGAGTAHASLEQGTATWVDDAGFRYQLTRNGDLTITGGTLLTDDKVTIKHFDIAQGTLGIQLNNAMLIGIVSCSASNPFKAPDTPAIGVGTDVNNALSIGIASSGASNPFRVPDVPAIGVETDVNEGGAAGLKVVFNRPALSGERLVIGVAGDDAATLSLLSGHGAQMLPDGGLEFLLQPGQTEIRFVVSSIADIAADTRYTLAATVYPADTNEVAATSSHLLTIHDGTYAVLPGSISHSMYGTSGADALHDTNANDSIETGAGDDEVAKHFAGNDQIVLGDGDDQFLFRPLVVGADEPLQEPTGFVYVDGGAGRDYLGGGDQDDTLEGGVDADGLYGGAGNDVLYGELAGEAQAFRPGSGLAFYAGKTQDLTPIRARLVRSAALLPLLQRVTNLQARYEPKKDGQYAPGNDYVAALNAVKRKLLMSCEHHFPPACQEALQTKIDAVRSECAADRVLSADTSHLAGTSSAGGGLAMVHTTENLRNVSFIHRFSMTLTPLIHLAETA